MVECLSCGCGISGLSTFHFPSTKDQEESAKARHLLQKMEIHLSTFQFHFLNRVGKNKANAFLFKWDARRQDVRKDGTE